MSYVYIVTLPVEPLLPGAQFLPNEQLPLHCTLMHWFNLGPDLTVSDLGIELGRWKHECRAGHIELVSKKPALFGPQSDTPVHVLEPTRALDSLHNWLLIFLIRKRCEFKRLYWVGAGYRAHVSTVNGQQFVPGSRHKATSLALIRRKDDNSKEVVDVYT